MRIFRSTIVALFFTAVCFSSGALAQSGETKLGTDAGASRTTGDYNTFIGERSGQSVTSSHQGTFVGYAAGRWITNDSDNTCIGYGAGAGGDFLTTDPDPDLGEVTPTPNGTDNVFVGTLAGQYCASTDNTFIGTEAGRYTTTGFDNTFVGEQAGYRNTEGDDNTFIGEDAGYSNTTGEDNTAVGSTALRSIETGFGNTVMGKDAGYDIDEGYNNTAIGTWSGEDIGAGSCNTTVGSLAGPNTEHADFNTFVGFMAGWDNNRTNSTTNANANTYMGSWAGATNREGSNNVIVGAYADFSNQDESNGGTSCLESTFWNGTMISRSNTDTNVSNITALGTSIRITGDDSTALGYSIVATGTRGITIGATAQGTHTDAITIGYGATSLGNDTVVIGNSDTVGWYPQADGATELGSDTQRFTSATAQAINVSAGIDTSADIVLTADDATDADDTWRVSAADSGDLTISSGATGVDVAMLTVANTGNVTVAGDITLDSDARLKVDIEPIDDALDLVCAVEARSYRWDPKLGRGDDLHIGFIAQEVAEVLPQLVRERRDGTLTVNYQGFVPLLVDAVRNLRDEHAQQLRAQGQEIDELRAIVAKQGAMLETLAARLDAAKR